MEHSMSSFSNSRPSDNFCYYNIGMPKIFILRCVANFESAFWIFHYFFHFKLYAEL